jgi:hypothetical protein
VILNISPTIFPEFGGIFYAPLSLICSALNTGGDSPSLFTTRNMVKTKKARSEVKQLKLNSKRAG